MGVIELPLLPDGYEYRVKDYDYESIGRKSVRLCIFKVHTTLVKPKFWDYIAGAIRMKPAAPSTRKDGTYVVGRVLLANGGMIESVNNLTDLDTVVQELMADFHRVTQDDQTLAVVRTIVDLANERK